MTDHPTKCQPFRLAALRELEELAERIPSAAPAGPTCCDVCQSEPALVTIGAVDYCARCAPEPDELRSVDEDLDDACLERIPA